MTIANQLKNELENCGKMPIFELGLENNEYDIVNISINVKTNQIEGNGNKFVALDIEDSKNLDYYLEGLLEAYHEA